MKRSNEQGYILLMLMLFITVLAIAGAAVILTATALHAFSSRESPQPGRAAGD